MVILVIFETYWASKANIRRICLRVEDPKRRTFHLGQSSLHTVKKPLALG